jgi:hypothetical protein
MKLTTNTIDVAAYTGSEAAHDIIPRQKSEVWIVPTKPLVPDVTGEWTYHRREEFVYVPLFPYLVPTNPALALGFMLQLGLSVVLPQGLNPSHVHLAIGQPMAEVQLPDGSVAWQYQVGIALCVK